MNKMRAAILKIPFEIGNPTGKRGPALAPEIIAKQLRGEKKGVVVSEDFEKTSNNIYNAGLEAWKTGNKLLALGGDHSITYGLVKAAVKVFKNLSLIYFDAHLDCEDDFLPPSHEDVLRAIINEKLIKPKNILVVGVRKTWPKEEKFIREHKISVLRTSALSGKGRAIRFREWLDLVRTFCEKAGDIYSSLDIDVVDPRDAPATNYPEKGGLRASELFAVLKLISSFNRNIGLDICEVSPLLDFEGKTIAVASTAASIFLTTKG